MTQILPTIVIRMLTWEQRLSISTSLNHKWWLLNNIKWPSSSRSITLNPSSLSMFHKASRCISLKWWFLSNPSNITLSNSSKWFNLNIWPNSSSLGSLSYSLCLSSLRWYRLFLSSNILILSSKCLCSTSHSSNLNKWCSLILINLRWPIKWLIRCNSSSLLIWYNKIQRGIRFSSLSNNKSPNNNNRYLNRSLSSRSNIYLLLLSSRFSKCLLSSNHNSNLSSSSQYRTSNILRHRSNRR